MADFANLRVWRKAHALALNIHSVGSSAMRSTSSSELEYHLIVARDTRAITESQFRSLRDRTIDVRKMLYGLSKRVANPDAV